MSETATKEIVNQINTAFAEGSTEGFLVHCTEDIKWTMAGDKPNQGKDSIREWMASENDCPEPPSFSVATMIAEGNSVVCHGDMTMKDPDGNDGKYAYCDIYKFSGDKVSELTSFISRYK